MTLTAVGLTYVSSAKGSSNLKANSTKPYLNYYFLTSLGLKTDSHLVLGLAGFAGVRWLSGLATERPVVKSIFQRPQQLRCLGRWNRITLYRNESNNPM